MPQSDIILALGIVVAAMAVFISGRLRVDLAALCVLTALVLTGLIRPGQAMDGFASEATGTVAAMFVLSGGLVRTGWVQWLARHLGVLAGKAEARLLLVICIAVAVLSAFIINAATVAIFIPVAIALAEERRISPSRVLMPLSFASQFGGVCTVIGTSTNILVSSIAVTYGLRAFGMFEFASLGLAMCAAGLLYLVLVTPRLIPEREGGIAKLDKCRLADYTAELRVKEGSALIGARWEDGPAREEQGLNLVQIHRRGKATSRASRTTVRTGDVLLLRGDADDIIAAQKKFGLMLLEGTQNVRRREASGEVRLVEALIPPGSWLIDRTYKGANLRRRFGCSVIAIQRRGKVLRTRLEDVRLDSGDSLLLQGDSDDVAALLKSDDLIVANELTELYVRRNRAFIALAIMVCVAALAAFEVMPILTAALLGAVGMVLAGCLTIEEAYETIDWKVTFLLGGIIPLGSAIEQTGAASWLANTFLQPFVDFGPFPVLATLYLTTAMLTETMSNNAAAVLLAPIAISLARAVGADPRPFLVAITFAASTSFATPVGYKTNTMVFAPGGYRLFDYTKVGGPLNLVFWILAVVLIPRIWPF